MAPGKSSMTGNQSPQKASSATSSAPRRSSRVQKRSVESSSSTSSEKLMEEAVKLLHEVASTSQQKKSGKRVSFEGYESENIVPSDLGSGEPQNVDSMNARRLTEPWFFPDSIARHNSQTAQAQVSPSRNQSERSASLGTRGSSMSRSSQASSSANCPIRTQKVIDLLEQDLIDEAREASKGKRRVEDHHRNLFDIDNTPAKRRKGGVTFPSRALPNDPVAHMLSLQRQNPERLSIEHISAMLSIIQDRIFGSEDGATKGFSKNFFSFILTPAQAAAWPLHELKTKYIPLLMTARYVADGSQTGWRNFFTRPESRQHLVSAIIGEWLTQRVFKHTAFGFPQYLTDILEEKDREYLHYDAVVRSKERAQLIKAWYEHAYIRNEIWESTLATADALAEELLTVLHPLLPSPLFEPSETTTSSSISPGRKDSISLRKIQQSTTLRKAIKIDLMDIILDSAAVHIGIRLTGIDGTIVRMCPNPAKGSPFHPTAPVSCVNLPSLLATQPDDRAKLIIKMACFPRVEAVVPSGPDLSHLEFLETQYRENLLLEAKCESHTNNPSPSAIQEFSWDDKSHIWPIVPDALQDNEGRSAGEFNPETNEINTVKRAAYVTIYTSLCPARVYCEWTRPSLSDDNTSAPESDRGMDLLTAIAHARRTHATRNLQLRVEDLKINLWNSWCLYGGLAQWGILSTTVLVALCRYFRVPTHLINGVVSLLRGAKSVARSAANLNINIPPVHLSDISDRVGHFWGHTGDRLLDPLAALANHLGLDGTAPAGAVHMDDLVPNTIADMNVDHKVNTNIVPASLTGLLDTARIGFAGLVAAAMNVAHLNHAVVDTAAGTGAGADMNDFEAWYPAAETEAEMEMEPAMDIEMDTNLPRSNVQVSTTDVVVEEMPSRETTGRDAGDGHVETGL